ncbi:MAG: 5'-nucleotidase C-terminal domain-containing protein [Paludibacteraceae bacterium]|nr:5'-nucleotidase C-terminal domain-containing protein [Paludibacteraceae bacterium]
MKKQFYCFLCALLAVMIVPEQTVSATCKQKKKSIVILYENDVHCAIDGYQAIAGLRDVVADTAYVAVVSSGDFVQGGTAGALSRGGYVADVMRTVGYDAITLGNHEFDFPVKHTDSLLRYIGAPIVCANLYNHETNRPVYQPFIIKKFGKTKIAFIGATTPGAFYTEMSAFYDGDRQIYDLRETTFFDVLQQTINAARKKGAKYVVVLSHLGEDPDRTGVNSHELAKRTTGIDIILDGHTHSVIEHDTVLNAAGKPVIVTETGTKFAHIGHLLIRDNKMTTRLIPFNTITQRNARVKAATDSVEWLMREKTQRVVCHSDVALRILNENGDQQVRMAETNLGDLVCDAYRVITGADIALANGGGIRSEKFAGDLTYGDIADILPYDNNLWIVEASGQRIIDLLQKNTSFIPVEDGSFPQVSGVRFSVHVADRTVSDVEVLNRDGQYEPINPKRTYTIGTIDYCVTGGGFYDMLKDCKVIHRGNELYRDVLVRYLESNLGGHVSNDYAEPQGRIHIIY